VLAASGARPIYLLDDIDAELSPSTLGSVWTVFRRDIGDISDVGDMGNTEAVVSVEKNVDRLHGQLFASSNRPQLWLTLPVGTLWQVEAGQITLL
jgi:hypothetical protein